MKVHVVRSLADQRYTGSTWRDLTGHNSLCIAKGKQLAKDTSMCCFTLHVFSVTMKLKLAFSVQSNVILVKLCQFEWFLLVRLILRVGFVHFFSPINLVKLWYFFSPLFPGIGLCAADIIWILSAHITSPGWRVPVLDIGTSSIACRNGSVGKFPSLAEVRVRPRLGPGSEGCITVWRTC